MTVLSDISVYRNQVYNFLNTVSIKYTPLSDQANLILSQQNQAVSDDPTTWKYYLNLQGLYHPTDTIMTVMSLDTQQQIEFTVENLAVHTRTKAAYVPGTDFFTDLCSRYLDQVDLIKSILYPISDVEAAIDAEEFTILACGTGFLEDTEFGYLFQELTNHLNYVRTRWFAPNLGYDPYYFITFWGMMWELLPQVLFSARFKAMRTPHAHSWLVWQYLTSMGLDDYSDILDRRRTMWLYRNIDYLLAHRGSKSNLTKMANNLLSSVGIGLFERYVLQQTVDGAMNCQLTPELIAVNIPTEYSNISQDAPAQTVDEIMRRQYGTGDEVDISAENIERVTQALRATTLNKYPTKLLEIRPLLKGKRYTEFFNTFVLDMVVGNINSGLYAPIVEISATESSIAQRLSGKDALIVFFYCMFRSMGITPTVLPYEYTARAMYKITPDAIPETFSMNGVTYYTRQVLDVDGFMANYNLLFPSSTVVSPDLHSIFLGQLYLVAMSQVDRGRAALGYLPQARAMEYVVNAMMHRGTVPLSLAGDVSTFDQWFASKPDFDQEFITPLNNAPDPKSAYSDMADAILTQLIPLDTVMETYGNFTSTVSTYAKLKKLFIQMCSYMITFLDSDLDVGTTLYIVGGGIAVASSTGADIEDIHLLPVSIVDSGGSYPIDLAVKDLSYTTIDRASDWSMTPPAQEVTQTVTDRGTDDLFVEMECVATLCDIEKETVGIDLSLTITDNFDTLS